MERMSFSEILQRRMKPLKYASDEEVNSKLRRGLSNSDGGHEEDKVSPSKYEITSQSSGEEDVTLGNDVRPQLKFLETRS